MKLYHSPASPFVRKALVAAHELGLAERIEIVGVAMTPVAGVDALNAENPLGKIPALVLEDGTTLYDSPVICEYLDTRHDGPRLFPPAGPERWTALRRQALADGLLDAAILCRYETFLRPAERQWADWIDGQRGKFRRALDALEGEAESFGDTVDIGTVAAACAADYLDFRSLDDGWRDGRPRLATWLEGFAERPSMRATRPSA
ncbi:MAG: glutathione S-transferase N-terminal domain-containing protein [Immundisolibacterales bacterium]|nr:glutathione S-transferase N-terminal domain-containing protein [Immundisolibacterales bacterium]